MYLVLAVVKEIEISLLRERRKLPFTQAGYFGMCPVFEKKEDAEEWADGKAEILPIVDRPQI